MAVAAIPADLFDVTTSFALEEKKKLRKHFARFDILFFLICTLVGLDTIGSVAAKARRGSAGCSSWGSSSSSRTRS